STNYNGGQGMIAGHVMALCEDSRGTIWAGGYQGLCTFSGERWSSIDASEQPPQGSVRAMAIDRDETMWVSLAKTIQSDLGFIAWRRKGQKRFEVSSEQLPTGEKLAVAQDTKIWAAQRGTGFVRAFTCSADKIEYTAPEISIGLSKSILVDRDGTLL